MKNITSLTKSHEVHVRIAEPADLPAIVAIYNQAVPTHQSTTNTIQVTVEDREAWFQEHKSHTYPIYVAEFEEQVVGWCSLNVYRAGRSALRFTAEISCYVDNGSHRHGVGRKLVNYAVEASPSLGIKNIVAVLIDRNDASRKLLEKLGFQQWGYLPRVLDFDGQECGEFYYGKRVAA